MSRERYSTPLTCARTGGRLEPNVCGNLLGYHHRVAATLARREDFGRERHGAAI